DFAIRGLVVDKRLGNLLKMDRHGHVGRVHHGIEQLSSAQRKQIYRAQRIGGERGRFTYVDTLFSLPEVVVYANLVTMLDQHPEAWGDRERPSYAQAFDDVRKAIDEAHQDNSIKAEIKRDPGRFLVEDPDLAPTLHKLRSAGKKIFLLTNSYAPYSDAVMRFLLANRLPSYEDWTKYFDWRFFVTQDPGSLADGTRLPEVILE